MSIDERRELVAADRNGTRAPPIDDQFGSGEIIFRSKQFLFGLVVDNIAGATVRIDVHNYMGTRDK